MTDEVGTEGQVGHQYGFAVVVNGPEDDVLDWHQVDWERVEDDVRRLRQRIFTASKAGDLKRARSLQKLMLRSRANALLSVRRVTEVNAGRKTAGVVPVKAALAFLLSVAAALGLVTAVFQWAWLHHPLGVQAVGPLASFLPIILIAVLFGLAMD